jgi:hypothetical protein
MPLLYEVKVGIVIVECLGRASFFEQKQELLSSKNRFIGQIISCCRVNYLPLLPPGPDGVHNPLSHEIRPPLSLKKLTPISCFSGRIFNPA